MLYHRRRAGLTCCKLHRHSILVLLRFSRLFHETSREKLHTGSAREVLLPENLWGTGFHSRRSRRRQVTRCVVFLYMFVHPAPGCVSDCLEQSVYVCRHLTHQARSSSWILSGQDFIRDHVFDFRDPACGCSLGRFGFRTFRFGAHRAVRAYLSCVTGAFKMTDDT